MKYAGIVLFNNRSSLKSVDYPAVTDALLAGGVFLEELCFLPYDAPSRLAETAARLALTFDGIFVIADPILLPAARETLKQVAEGGSWEEYLLETPAHLFGVLPTGKKGAEVVKRETVARIDRRRKQSYLRLVFRCALVPEEVLRGAMGKAAAVGGGSFALHTAERYGDVRVELIYDRLTPKMAADEAARILAEELSDYLYAVEDVPLAEQLVKLLRLRRMKLSTAESFTGGGVGRAVVSVAGASEVFFEGVNAYNEGAKTARLGVKEATLKARGAVSDETAYEMASGLLLAGNCDLAVATTGYAGPSAGNEPVGLCYIAVGTKEAVHVYRCMLAGDRETITETAITYALFCAYREIR